MPFPNEHSARVRNPEDFQKDSFRRIKLPKSEGGKGGVSVIIGRLKGKTTTTAQAYRFPIKLYTAEEAKKWLKDNKIKFISFEPAEPKKDGDEIEEIKDIDLMELEDLEILEEFKGDDTIELKFIGSDLKIIKHADIAEIKRRIKDGDEIKEIKDEGKSEESNSDTEKKYMDFDFEIKELDSDSDSEYFTFKGYASTFNNKDQGNDIILPGAFEKTINKFMPKLLWQHNTKEPLGIFTEIIEDEKGLYIEGKMPKADTFVKGRVIPQMKAGSINSMSIGFSLWGKDGDFDVENQGDCENRVRKIKRLTLWEISLVTIPMNPKAKITNYKNYADNNIFELIESVKTIRDIDNLFNEFGFSTQETNTLISKFKRITRDELNAREEQEMLKNLINDLEQTITIAKELNNA